jgi:hypothetical protein
MFDLDNLHPNPNLTVEFGGGADTCTALRSVRCSAGEAEGAGYNPHIAPAQLTQPTSGHIRQIPENQNCHEYNHDMTQYFFADESGEPGLQSDRGSAYFVIAMAQMPKWEPIPELAALRKDLHLSPSFEFHYVKMSAVQKQTFYQAVIPVAFRVRSAVLLKDNLPAFYREMNGFELTIELLTGLTLRASPLDIGGDILVIDGATDALRSALRIRLSQECRKTNRPRPFGKIATASSKREDGLQLADMVVGAIRDHALGRSVEYRQTFMNKIVDLWEVR